MPDNPGGNEPSDEELVSAIHLRHDSKATDAIFRRYKPHLTRFIYSRLAASASFYKFRFFQQKDEEKRASYTDYIFQEAAELFEDSWVRALSRLRSFNPDLGSFKNWFFTLVQNVINDYWEKRKEYPMTMGGEELERISDREIEQNPAVVYDQSPVYSALASAVAEEAGRLALEAIEEIENEDYRTAFYVRLLMFGVYGEAELADSLGRNESTFRSDITRGKEAWEKNFERKAPGIAASEVLEYFQKGGGAIMDREEMLGRIKDPEARKAFDLRVRFGPDYNRIAKELNRTIEEVKFLLSAALSQVTGIRNVRGFEQAEQGSLPGSQKDKVFFETFDLLSRGIEPSDRPTRARPDLIKEQNAAKLLFYALNGSPVKAQTLGSLLSRVSKEKKKSFNAVAKGSGMSVDEFAGFISGAKKPGKTALKKLSGSLGIPLDELQKASKVSAIRTAARATRGEGRGGWKKVEQRTLKLLHSMLEKERKGG